MFSRRDGPTALRRELVRAMAFSEGECAIDTPQGPSLARAGLVAVWNGSLGQVLLLIRFPEHGHVERFAFQKRITTQRELDDAVQSALESTKRLGLVMDDPEFHALDEEGRGLRVKAWNELRRPGVPDPARVGTPRPTATIPPPGSAPNADSRAVLGRVAVVRRRLEELELEEEVELEISSDGN